MTSPLARRLLATAAVLGILANWLLRADGWRAGFALWMLLALAVTALVPSATPSDPAAQRDRRALCAVAAALVLLLVLRDADTLYVLDFFALLVVIFLLAWRAGGRPLTQLEPRDALIGILRSISAAAGGAPTLVRDLDVRPVDAGTRRVYRGFGLGSLVAAPVLLAVTGLLASADPLFASFVEQTGDLLQLTRVGDFVFIMAATWVTAGALRGSVVPVGLRDALLRHEFAVPFATVLPLLGGLAVLLSAWIGLQVGTLFGGSEYLAATAGVTAAQYARDGFFELIVIAGIVLAALLVADDLLERSAGRERTSFRTLGVVLIGLVGALLLSAVSRLLVYLRFYGLTDDRVLALAILVWVAAVLLWFALTVLRDARLRFAPGVLVISALWLAAFNVLNPERRTVETNLRRAEQGLPFDVAYHAKLSGDAVPTLLRDADRLGPVRAAELRAALTATWAERAATNADWRLWSLPQQAAIRALQVAPARGN